MSDEMAGELSVVTVGLSVAPPMIRAVAQVREFPWCVRSAEEQVETPYSRPAFEAQIKRIAAQAVGEAIENMYNSDLFPWWRAALDPEALAEDDERAARRRNELT